MFKFSGPIIAAWAWPLIAVLGLLSLTGTARGEGSRELLNGDSTNAGGVVLVSDGSVIDFAYNHIPEQQLRVQVAKPAERIYMAFNITNSNWSCAARYQNRSCEQSDLYVRIRRASDNAIVKGPYRLRPGHDGWVPYVGQAMAGPAALVGSAGYAKPWVFNPAQAGEFILEFAIDNQPSSGQQRVARFFDVTVHDPATAGAGGIRRGRLFSETWPFNTYGTGPSHRFRARLYAYSNDSVVTRFDFNGMQGFGFNVTCNANGVRSDLKPEQNRQSDYHPTLLGQGVTPGAPDYPIFLNDPDHESFPSGDVGDIENIAVQPCADESYCVWVEVSGNGTLEVLLRFPNGTKRLFLEGVEAGRHCIPWDGRDGDGNLVLNGTPVDIRVGFLTGLTHLPLRDVEHQRTGFKVALERPQVTTAGDSLPPPQLYWDDSKITSGNVLDTQTEFQGTSGPAHRWSGRGNNRNQEWINTWWYTNQAREERDFTVDSSKWKVFSELDVSPACQFSKTLTMKARFDNSSIRIDSMDFNFSTNYPQYLKPTDTDTVVQGQMTEVHFQYSVDSQLKNAPPPVQLDFNVRAHSAEYPYCKTNSQQSCSVFFLPAELYSFRGEAQTRDAVLQWQAERERNVAHYTLARSRGEAPFERVAKLAARGGDHRYRYRDAALAPGTYHYRLTSHDLDGTRNVHGRAVRVTIGPGPAALRHQPGRGQVTVDGGDAPLVRLRLLDAAGRPHAQCRNCRQLSTRGLASGVYLALALTQDGRLLKRRFWVP